MNIEIEIKVKLNNPEQVEETLRKSAKFIKEKTQRDEYFTPKHNNFFDKKTPTEYLRVRHEDNNHNIGYHFLHLDENDELLKTEEYEAGIKDPEMMMELLKKLEMVHKVTVTKLRKTFEYKDFEVVLDFIKELGYFMEVEAKNITGTPQEIKKQCYEILKELGADWEEVDSPGYPLMVLKQK